MAFVDINPAYAEFLRELGLVRADDFLSHEAVIVSGHPDRNVSRVILGTGPVTVTAYLKREHRVRWQDRVLNALAGYGFVSKSKRECLTLQALRQAHVGCPDWIACGEDGAGRAFLLIRAIDSATELRDFSQENLDAPERRRRKFAQRLGVALAQFHNAGFNHPDLYSKHVLITQEGRGIYFLDWQRSTRRPFLGWRQRCHDLAALDATIAEQLASMPERVACLRAYLRKCRAGHVPHAGNLLRSAFQIMEQERRLLKQRRIREQRQLHAGKHHQCVIWRDGEGLCVTPEFEAEWDGQLPAWLRLDSLPEQGSKLILRESVHLPNRRFGQLIRRRARHLLKSAWSWCRGRRVTSPELLLSGLLFRLERAGVVTPRLLAFGQRTRGMAVTESFILTEPVANTVGIGDWLRAEYFRNESPEQLFAFRRSIRRLGAFMAKLHDAHCHFSGSVQSSREAVNALIRVRQVPGRDAEFVLGSMDELATCRRPYSRMLIADLVVMRRALAGLTESRSDEMRFLLAYCHVRRLTPTAKELIRSVLRKPVRLLAQEPFETILAEADSNLAVAREGATP
jgi:tRNA A-37 threonylcarbamoyl transferase component Bud32